MNQMQQISASETPDRPVNLNPVQWAQALGMARKLCSDIFQEGGGPRDAVRAFVKPYKTGEIQHWGQAINAIALSLYVPRRSSVH